MSTETTPPTPRNSPRDSTRRPALAVRTHVRVGLSALPPGLGPRSWGGDIEIGQGI